jgi:hypothetical protein
MVTGRLAALAVAIAASGAAWGQTSFDPGPAPDKLWEAVNSAGCERSETEAFVRFYCEEGGALWYFTHQGRPEHPAYQVMSVDDLPYDRFVLIPRDRRESGRQTTGFGRGGFGGNYETQSAWLRGIHDAWKEDVARLQLKPRRDRGKLYPLEPS